MNPFSGGPQILDETVAELSDRFHEFLLTGQIASRNGFLQNVTPVVTLVGIFVLVGTTVATHNSIVLGGLFVVSLGLARLSKIPLGLHVSRWLFVVVLSLVVVLPQLFLMGGRPLVSVFGFTISRAGAAYVLRFTLRVSASVSFLSLVILTTNFDALLGALRRVRLPESIVSIVGITYRYLLLFFAELNRMVLAQQSRTFERTTIRESWTRLGNLLGTFFLRTIERGERVQLAARSRGGTRSFQPYERTEELTRNDYLFGCLVVTVLVAWGVIVWIL